MATKKKNKSPLRLLVPLVVLGGVGLLAAGAFGKGPAAGMLADLTGGGDETALAGPTVVRGPMTISVTSRGELTASNSVVIRSEVRGRNAILSLIPEGTRVQAGDIVAELDVSEMEDDRVQQEISVQNAEADWVKATQQLEIQESQNLSDIESAKRALRFAEKDLEKYLEGDWPQQLASADEEITLAAEELKQSEDYLKYSEELYAEGFLTRTELDSDRLAFQRRELALKQAERAKELLVEYDNPKQEETLKADIEEARRELDRVKLQAAARLVDYEQEVSSSKARLELERADLAKILDQIEKSTVRAPIGGLVIYARDDSRWGDDDPIQEGTEVREREEIITIPREGGMIVEASLHESIIKKVEAGQQCAVRVDALPGRTFTGEVKFVALLPDSGSFWANPNQRLFKTRIEVLDGVPEMRPGMSCEVEILVDQLGDVLQIPVQAVFRDGSENICFVAGPEGVERVPVEIGLDNDRWVQIVSGLEEGQTVLLSPPADFKLEPASEEAAPESEDAEGPVRPDARASDTGGRGGMRPGGEGRDGSPRDAEAGGGRPGGAQQQPGNGGQPNGQRPR